MVSGACRAGALTIGCFPLQYVSRSIRYKRKIEEFSDCTIIVAVAGRLKIGFLDYLLASKTLAMDSYGMYWHSPNFCLTESWLKHGRNEQNLDR